MVTGAIVASTHSLRGALPKLGQPVRVPDPLDELDVLSLRESSEALERVIADQQPQARTDQYLRLTYR